MVGGVGDERRLVEGHPRFDGRPDVNFGRDLVFADALQRYLDTTDRLLLLAVLGVEVPDSDRLAVAVRGQFVGCEAVVFNIEIYRFKIGADRTTIIVIINPIYCIILSGLRFNDGINFNVEFSIFFVNIIFFVNGDSKCAIIYLFRINDTILNVRI
ncbi:MAG: hypothetical protein PPP58_11740 [Natronomonas sp.]